MNPKYKRVSQAAVATAVSLLVGSGAEAAAVKGLWDPAFGPGDPAIGWSGVANFSVLDSCVTGANTSSGSVFVGSSGCAMSFVDAQVTLYQLANSGTFETLTYSPADGVGAVNGLEIKNIGGSNTVVGIDTSLIGAQLAGNPLIYQGPFWIFFQPGAIDGAWGQEGNCDGPSSCFPNPNRISNPAPLRITTCLDSAPTACTTFAEPGAVPEPGTMGLVLGALGAGWFARRRKKAA